MRASTVRSFNPMFRTVSIIPGIDSRAPDRQERSRGLESLPNLAPIASSILPRAASTSSFTPAGYWPLDLEYSTQTSVSIVKPAGTGRPVLDISARLAPLPPRVFFIVRSPSAVPAPKE